MAHGRGSRLRRVPRSAAGAVIASVMFLSLGGVLLSLATLVLAGRPRWDLVVLTLGSQTMVILPGPDMPEEARQRLYGIVTELRPAA